ncbi:MAG: hypothetical protein R3B84_11855 [Zavarzinella sp.]
MAKANADKMKKQMFWLLLIAVVIGIVLIWAGVFLDVDSTIVAKTEENDKNKKEFLSLQSQSKKLIAQHEAQKEELFKLRNQRWQEMAKLQSGLFYWPESLGEEQINKVTGKKFGDPINDSSFADAVKDRFIEGYEQLAKDVAPLQFGGGWQYAFDRPIMQWAKRPSSEEIWLAREDLSVQAAVVRAIAKVNKDVSIMHRVGAPNAPKVLMANRLTNPPPTNTERNVTVYNRIWRLDLRLEAGMGGAQLLKGRLTNLTNRLQSFNATRDLIFNVWFTDDEQEKPFEFHVEGTQLPGHLDSLASMEIPFVQSKHSLFRSVNRIVRVEQVFDPRTAPVKQLNKISLTKLSAKHANAQLQMTPFSEKEAEAEKAAAAPVGGADGMGSGMPGPGGAPAGVGIGGPGGGPGIPGGPGSGGAQQAAVGDYTTNMLPRRRYLSRTEQVRAIPVGLSVLVDQAFTLDFLAALENSDLRMQIVQTHWTRINRSSIGANSSYGNPGGSIGSPEGGPGFPMPGVPGGGEGFLPPMPGDQDGRGEGPGSIGPGSGGYTGSSDWLGNAASRDEDAVIGSLVEYSVYGIASVYEKYVEPATQKDNNNPNNPLPKTPAGPAIPPPGPAIPAPKGGV